MGVHTTPRLALPYPDGSDLLRDGDNRIHDLAAALDTITATVDELEAIELTPGPPGPAGADGADGPAGPPGPSASIFRFRAKVPTTSGDPGPGFLRWNTVPQISATQLAIDVVDQDNLDVTLGLSSISDGNEIYLQEYGVGANFQNWRVTGPGTDNTGYWTYPVTLIGSGGTGTSGFINGLMLAVRVTRPGGLATRANATYTTASLAANAEDTAATLTLAKAYRLLRLQTSRPARVRIYTTAAKRTADIARAVGTDVTQGTDHGLMLEYVTQTGVLTADLSPTVGGFNGETTPSSTIPVSIQNKDSGAGTVTLTLTYLPVEA